MFAEKASAFLPTMNQVPLSVLPYFRFLSEEAQRNVMSQLIDNFQTTSITKRVTASTSAAMAAATASSSSTSPEGLAFMRSPMFTKVKTALCGKGSRTLNNSVCFGRRVFEGDLRE